MSTSRTREKADGELFKSTGIDDNATSTAITIDASENVGIGNTASGFNVQADNLSVGTGSGANGITIYSGNDSSGNIFFADGTSGDDPTRGGINYNHADNSISFRVNDSPKMSIDSSGHAIIGGGVTLGNGQTYAAANTLDDYEEGVANLTYVSTGSTFNYSVRKCYYTKVGRIVHISVYMQLDGSQTLSANTVHISGLPFAAANNGGQEATAICGIRYVNFRTGYNALQARISPNQSKIDLYEQGDNQSGVGLVADQLSNSSGQIFFTMSYIAA
jgi:hypothetical protein